MFYVLKIVLSRLLSTGSAKTVERTVEKFKDIMERDYAGVIKRKLGDVYRTTGGTMGPSSRGERGERESRVMFIVSHLIPIIIKS